VAIATALYLVARQTVLGHGFGLSEGGFAQRVSGAGERLLQAAQNGWRSLRLFVFPWPLSIDHDRHLLGEPGAKDVAIAAALFAAIGGALWRWPKLRARCGLPLLLALLFFLPTSGLIAMKSPMAERFLLIPCALLSIAAIAAIPGPGFARFVLLPAALVALSTVTFVRTRQFRSEETLWNAELAIHPASIQARLGLLQLATERRDFDAANRMATSVVALAPKSDPRRIAALFALGRVAIDQGREDAAQPYLEQARAEITERGRAGDLDPTLHLIYVALANWRRTRLGAADAEAIAREGIERFGRQPRLLEALAIARDEQGDAAAAEALYREALRSEETVTLRYHLALALHHQGRRDAAREEVRRALTIDPSHVPSRHLGDELR
jgi:tetratricopeptide (TPR) repeat protein